MLAPIPNTTPGPARTCTKCGATKGLEAFYARPNGSVDGRCRECIRLRRNEYAKENPDAISRARKRWYAKEGADYHRRRREKDLASFLVTHARARAKAKGVPFAITARDVVVPGFCPVLGVRLQLTPGKAGPCSPSLDRVIPTLGYVPGNVCVISWRANGLKNDGTLEELEAIVRWLRQRQGGR